MTIKLTNAQKTAAFAIILVLFFALTGCGTSTTGILEAAAGVETPTAESVVEEIPTEVPLPTETPIPDTYGHIIYVSNQGGQMSLYMTTPNGIEQTRLTVNAEDNTPRISPDGTRVAFVSTVGGNMDVYVLDLASRAVTRVTDAPQKDAAPSWSPDGRMLAFESFRDGNFEIYAVGADGANPIRLTNDPSGDTSPVWSPVSNEVAFISNRFGNSDIVVVDMNGIISPITTGRASDFDPRWSPDGNLIAYKESSGGEISRVCLISRSGLDQRCLNSPSEYSAPAWSPNGQYLAFNAKQTLGYGVDVVNMLDGSIAHFSDPAIDPRGAPFWSPEGLRLVFQAQIDGNMELFTMLTLTNEFARLTNTPDNESEPIWSGN